MMVIYFFLHRLYVHDTWYLKQYVSQQSLPIYAEWALTKDLYLVSYILLLFVAFNNPYELLNAVLKDITFKAGGNIIASCSKGENIDNPQ